MHVICFPIYEARICGFPDSVTLTNAEHKAMARIHLGGLEALRTPAYKCACKTVDSLVKKGLLDKAGVTTLGKRVAETAANAEHETAQSGGVN